MTRSPVTIEDGCYFSVAEFDLYVVRLLGANMELQFERRDDRKKGFVLELHDVVAVSDWRKGAPLQKMRVDHDRTCHGLDIALQLQEPAYEEYKVLYLFDEERNSTPVFRALAKAADLRYWWSI